MKKSIPTRHGSGSSSYFPNRKTCRIAASLCQGDTRDRVGYPVPRGRALEAREFVAEVGRERAEEFRDALVRDLLGRVVEARRGPLGGANVRGDLLLGLDAGDLGQEVGLALLGGAANVLPLGGSFGRRGGLHFLRVVHDVFSVALLRLRAGESDVCSPLFTQSLPLPVRPGKGIHQNSRGPFHLETASERIHGPDDPVAGRSLALRVQPAIGRGHGERDSVEPIVRRSAVRTDVGTMERGEDGIPLVLGTARDRGFRLALDFEESIRQVADIVRGERKTIPHADAIRETPNLLLEVVPRLDCRLDPFLHDRGMIFLPRDTVRDREIVRTGQESGKHVLAPRTVGNEFPLGLASVVRIDQDHVVNEFLTLRHLDAARVQSDAKDFHGFATIRKETATEHGIGGRPSRVAERLHLGRDVHQGHRSVGLGNVFRSDDAAIVAPEEHELIRDRSLRLGVDRLDTADAVIPLASREELGQGMVQLVGQRTLDGHPDAGRGIVLGVEKRHGFLLLASCHIGR